MRMLKGLFLFAIFVILVPLWLVFQIYVSADQTVLNYDYIIEKIDESGLYDQAISEMRSQFSRSIGDTRGSLDNEYYRIISSAMEKALTKENIEKLIRSELKGIIDGAKELVIYGNLQVDWLAVDFSILNDAMIEEIRKLEMPELTQYMESLLLEQQNEFYFLKNVQIEEYISDFVVPVQLFFWGPFILLGVLLLVTILIGGVGKGFKWIGASVIVGSILFLLITAVSLAAAGDYGLFDGGSVDIEETGRMMVGFIFEPMLPIGGIFFAGGVVFVIIGSILKRNDRDIVEE